MRWQDAAITACSIVFIIGLIPMLRHKHKPPLSTSVPTFIALYVMAWTQLSLGLRFGFLSTYTTATMWLILAYQRHAH